MTGDEATRHEGVLLDPEMTRHEGVHDPEATRHEGTPGTPGAPSQSWYQLPAGVERQYQVVRMLSNAGGQADILLCRDRDSGAEVVVKLYRGRPKIDMSTYEKLQGLSAEHVTPIILNIEDDGTWEVQEYFPHGSLHDLLNSRGGGPQPSAWVRQVLAELASALAALHSEQITHRDLKPGNVFVRTLEPLDLVLGDFGFARDISMSSEYMSVVGVFHYTAPEVLMGRVSPAADWWALGTIVFELLTGHSLFVDDTGRRQNNQNAVRQALDQGAYSTADVTDPRWQLLLRGLLNRSYKHRWGHREVLEWLDGGSPEVLEVTESTSPRTSTPQSFALPWGTYDTPAAVVASMARNWDDACGYLNGRGATHLRMWLERWQVDLAASQALKAMHDQDISADEALVLLQLVVVPEQQVEFRGRSVTGATLAAVARSAASGDQDAQDWIVKLRRNQVLGTVAPHIENGEQIAAIDLRLRTGGDRLDQLLSEAESDRQLREFVTAQRGPLEGVVLASCLDVGQVARHLAAARTVAAEVTSDDPEILRSWSRTAAKGGLPEAIVLEHVGAPVVEDRKARQLAERRATQEREAHERRERQAREQRQRARDAAHRGGGRLAASAILVAFMTLTTVLYVSSMNLGVHWQTLAWAYAAPLVACIALAFVIECVIPIDPPIVSYALGLAVMAWRGMAELPSLEAFAPLGRDDPALWFTELFWWFLGGYVVGLGLGLLAERVKGDSEDPPLLTVLLPLGAIVATVFVALLGHLDLATMPGPAGWGPKAAEAVTFPVIHSLPPELMWNVTVAVGLASLLVLSMYETVGRLPKGWSRAIRVGLAVVALFVIVYHLPMAFIALWLYLGVALAVGAVSVVVTVTAKD